MCESEISKWEGEEKTRAERTVSVKVWVLTQLTGLSGGASWMQRWSDALVPGKLAGHRAHWSPTSLWQNTWAHPKPTQTEAV